MLLNFLSFTIVVYDLYIYIYIYIYINTYIVTQRDGFRKVDSKSSTYHPPV